MPALLLDYFGQGALLITDPDARRHPFFAMVPAGWPTYALVVLASVTTVIASQALISGAFSLTHQAVQLGFFPRVTVKHTSRATEGQIYIPEINWGLAVACIVLVLVFRASSNLAAAYGIAVTGTMAITSVTFFEVARTRWRWPLWRTIPLLAVFLSFDLPFFASTLFKFEDGGYVPILVGAALSVVMMIWRHGRRVYGEYLASIASPLGAFIAKVPGEELRRIPGAGIFLTADLEGVPRVISNMAARMRCLPETVVLVTVKILHAPHVRESCTAIEDLGSGFRRAILTFGFMDASDVPSALRGVRVLLGPSVDLDAVTYYAARDTFVGSPKGEMGSFTEGLFAFLYRNAKSATHQFCIPPTRVVEIGTQIDL
jgi:KUP system potassium uptake protein